MKWLLCAAIALCLSFKAVVAAENFLLVNEEAISNFKMLVLRSDRLIGEGNDGKAGFFGKAALLEKNSPQRATELAHYWEGKVATALGPETEDSRVYLKMKLAYYHDNRQQSEQMLDVLLAAAEREKAK